MTSKNGKLFCLCGALIGEPKILETPHDNYTNSFKTSGQRYENKRIIVDCHIKSIFNRQLIEHESAKNLNLIDNAKKNLRSLKVLDFDRDNFSSTKCCSG